MLLDRLRVSRGSSRWASDHCGLAVLRPDDRHVHLHGSSDGLFLRFETVGLLGQSRGCKEVACFWMKPTTLL